MAKERKVTLPLSADLLEKLANFQEIELQDVILDLEEIELNIGSSVGGMNPAVMGRLAYEISLISGIGVGVGRRTGCISGKS